MKKILILLIFICPAFVLAKQININYATLPQLDELTGVGPAYAQRIVEGRPYSSVDDLLRVRGIGPATLQKIKDQGWACVDCQATENPNVQDLNSDQIISPNNKTTTADQANNPTTANTTTDTIPISETQSSTLAISYPGGVYINEILPSPEGADDQEEWIEVFNQNNFEVDLSGWKIKDASGSITTYVFPKSIKIASLGYLVLKRTETKITLNNAEDELFFLTPDEKVVDSLAYKNAPRNQSYNKTNNDWAWSNFSTPGSKNIVSQGPQKNAGSLSISKKSDNNINKVEVGDLTAGLSQGSSQKEAKITSPWFLFLTALAITIFSAIITLFIKFKFRPAE